MEEHPPSSSPSQTASALSGATLRELQQRARAALTASREQAARLEDDIARRLDEIAAVLNEQILAESRTASDAEQHDAEFTRLAEELKTSREMWAVEREALVSETARLTAELQTAADERQQEQELFAREVTRLTEESKVSDDDWRRERESLRQEAAQLAAELKTSRSDWQLEQKSLSSEVARLTQDLQSSGDERFQQQESLAADVKRLTAELKASTDAWSQERAALTKNVERLTEELEGWKKDWQSEREKLTDEKARLTQEIEAARTGGQQEQQSLQQERDELAAQVEELEARQRASQEEWRKQLLDFEAKLREQQKTWNEQRAELATSRAELERERDELQQKFELALKDVQRLRERGAELEHDLARRPEANQVDSAELVALRTERDELAARVEQLEQQPTAQIDPDVEQQLSDLQRRFEMAVEDVRELKTKNAKLESRLASSARPAPAGHDAGGMDWESQKRRMLAALAEGDDDQSDPVVQQERATIAGTIEMTDAVVAEKDRQLAELAAELEAVRNNPAANDEARDRRVNDLCNADEIIAEHRKRSHEMEREMEDKLRAAELELSVERAKMARQKAELEELRANLQSERQLYEGTGGPPAPGAPRRRWLSKLGIDSKDKEKD